MRAVDYASVRLEAQEEANMLPGREYRFGFERRCEVVSCDRLDKCQPGHGPVRS